MSSTIGYLLKLAQGPTQQDDSGLPWDPQEIVFRDYINPLLDYQVPSRMLRGLREVYEGTAPARLREYFRNPPRFAIARGPGHPQHGIDYVQASLPGWLGVAATSPRRNTNQERLGTYGNHATDLRSAFVPSWMTARRILARDQNYRATPASRDELVRLFANASPDVKRQVVQFMRGSMPTRPAYVVLDEDHNSAFANYKDREVVIPVSKFSPKEEVPVAMTFTHEAHHLRDKESLDWPEGYGFYSRSSGNPARRQQIDKMNLLYGNKIRGRSLAQANTAIAEFGPQMAEMGALGRFWQAMKNSPNATPEQRQGADHALRMTPINPFGNYNRFMDAVKRVGLDPASGSDYYPDQTFHTLLKFPSVRREFLTRRGFYNQRPGTTPQAQRVADYVTKYDPQVEKQIPKTNNPETLERMSINNLEDYNPAQRALMWNKARVLRQRKR